MLLFFWSLMHCSFFQKCLFIVALPWLLIDPPGLMVKLFWVFVPGFLIFSPAFKIAVFLLSLFRDLELNRTHHFKNSMSLG